MHLRTIVPRVVLAGVVIVVAIILLTGSDGYHVSVALNNAYGLESGSNVRVGGVDGGKVSLRLDDQDRVIATMKLDKPVGRDATVSIVAANFLGAKRLLLTQGNVKGDPAPSGYRLSSSTVSVPTDLDQLLDVFDAPTRVRAQMLLNEAGRAVMGRSVDIRSLLNDFPMGLDDAGQVIRSLSTDNATMDALIQRSDRFVAEAAAKHRQLDHLVDTVGQTAVTVNARRDELRATLAQAPATLERLRTFTNDLVATTQQLEPAAREITRTAGPLSGTLAQVEPLREAAAPALRTATDISPDLTRLARGATPVVRRAAPAVRSLAVLGEALPPVTNALNGSFANFLGVLENWSQAIQFRDGLSHVFRGEATFSPDTPLGVVEALTGQPVGRSTTKQRKGKATPKQQHPAAPGNVEQAALPSTPAGSLLDQILKGTPVPGVLNGTALNKLLDGSGDNPLAGLLQGGQGTAGSSSSGSGTSQQLLDFLLKP